MNNKSILVFGGNGFIGKNFVNKFCKNNSVTVVYFKKKNNFIKKNNVEYINLDIKSYKQISKKLSLDYDYIVNLSGYVDHSNLNNSGFSVIDTHLLGLFNLVKYFKKSNQLKKFIQIGSGDEYGNNIMPFRELKREQPFSPYSYAKVAANHFLEMSFKNIEFPAVGCRIFLSYGPYQDYNRLIPQVIFGCLNNLSFPVSSGKQYRDFCYIDDVVNAIEVLIKSRKTSGNIYNIGSAKPIMVKTIIKKIHKIIGTGNPKFGNNPLRKNENLKLFANTDKIFKDTKWKPKIDIDDGLKKTIKYYKKILNES